jgi:two-component system chemotaxis response regulator CheB
MTHRDIIVVGASKGGVEALPQLVAGLPGDLDAAVLVVLHMAPNAPSYLAPRLDAAGPLPAAPARDGEELEAGRIYVAVPDRHLLIEGSRIRLSRGPKENFARPAIDTLFRSAATYHGSRVIGVVLTGLLDDGTSGLWSIKERGGIAIVQSPDEAPYPSMPRSALQHVEIDHVLPIAGMPDVLQVLTRAEPTEPSAMSAKNLEIEARIALEDNALQQGVRSLGRPSFYTCPECHGSMVAIDDGTILRFRCHTGHAFTAAALADQGLGGVEQTLWAALAQLEEHEVLLGELQERAVPEAAAGYAVRIAQTKQLARRIREIALEPALGRPHPEAGDD